MQWCVEAGDNEVEINECLIIIWWQR